MKSACPWINCNLVSGQPGLVNDVREFDLFVDFLLL